MRDNGKGTMMLAFSYNSPGDPPSPKLPAIDKGTGYGKKPKVMKSP